MFIVESLDFDEAALVGCDGAAVLTDRDDVAADVVGDGLLIADDVCTWAIGCLGRRVGIKRAGLTFDEDSLEVTAGRLGWPRINLYC